MSSPQIATNTVIVTKNNRIFSKVISLILLFISLVLFFAASWYVGKFGKTGFDSIIFTLFANTDGVQAKDLVNSYLFCGLLPAILSFAAISFVLFFFPKRKVLTFKIRKFGIHLLPLKHWCSVVISLILSFILLLTAANTSQLTEYLKGMTTVSTFFDEQYIDPENVDIKFPEKKRNLIYIFLESIETTYFSKEQGGALEYSIIPELYDLAEDNINFSHTDGVGGFATPVGTTWTVAAMTAHTSGVNLKAPLSFERNKYGSDGFLPGICNLTDILNENGYYQTLMVGSDSSFANRDVYYKNHGVDKIYDLYSAQKDGIVPEGYHVWWGMEDKHLFKYAKQELRSIASKDEPFAFTLLTVDTHFTDGYVCDLCDNKHEQQYENVISCSSKQVYDFIKWIKRQSFYKDTTIIIAGDHLTMDSQYIGKNVEHGFDQRVYNCFINPAVTSTHYKNRQFTSLDMFPTTLAAIGCEIPGERLGLGTNLFSGKKTLSEEIGYDEFNKQLGLNSVYYNENFLK